MNDTPDDRHPTPEELVLLYYEEPEALGAAGATRVARHLDECAPCSDEYARLERTLAAVTRPVVPERGPDYEARVWERLQAGLQRPPWLAAAPGRQVASWWARAGAATAAARQWLRPRRLAWAAAATSLIVAAFLLGRGFAPAPGGPFGSSTPAADIPSDARPAPHERILLVALADHLDSTQMILVELANADTGDGLDVSREARRAQRLVNDNRLYRQVADRAEEPRLVSLLESLERVLVELANAPDELDAADVEALRARIEEEGLLFKVRIVGSEVRRRDPVPERGAARPAGDDPSTTSET